jgi:hypothetical protein
MARFAVVVAIELLALALCFAPLASREAAWQVDCFKVGEVATIAALVTMVLTSFFCFIWPKNKPEDLIDRQLNHFMEAGIVFIYIINAMSLAAIVARTGGPAASLYAPLIPIQLSGIIFLQIEKEILVEETSLIPLFYTLIACAALLSSYWFSGFYYWLLKFKTDKEMFDYSLWNTGLTISGMLLAFFTYWLPKQKKLTETFQKWYPSKPVSGTQSANP